MSKPKPRRVAVKEFNLFDNYGEQVVHHVSTVPQGLLGKGWIAMYKKPLRKLATECPHLSTLKVYLHVAGKETYKKGVIISNECIANELGISERSVERAIDWLREHGYMLTVEIDGVRAFIFNPQINVCSGRSKQGKKELWAAAVQKELALRSEKIREGNAVLEAIDALIQEKLKPDDEEEVDDSGAEEAELHAKSDSAIQVRNMQSVQVLSELDT